MSIKAIISPLTGEDPSGENVRISGSAREIYFEIKDARNAARTLERAQNPGEIIKVGQEWKDVNRACLQLLSEKSKDIELLAWLMEAQLRLYSFVGLRDTYVAAEQLIREYGDSLYSVDDDPEERFAPFAGLNGSGGEGTLIQPIRLSSLVPGNDFAQNSLWDFQLSQRDGEDDRRELLSQAIAEAGQEAVAQRLREVDECIQAFNAFTKAVDSVAGSHAPSSANIRNTLHEVAAAIRTLGGFGDASPGEATGDGLVAANENETTSPAPAIAERPASGEIRSRDEAFDTLSAVARYFRKNEPHSPIALSIETLVRRGRMDFSELLAELLPEIDTRNAVLTAAGIQPRNEEND